MFCQPTARNFPINKKVVWTSFAENDFSNILEYLYQNWNSNVTNSFIDRVEKSIKNISKNPEIYPIIFKDLEIRRNVITKQNSIYFVEKEGEIIILRLYDNRQNPNKLTF